MDDSLSSALKKKMDTIRADNSTLVDDGSDDAEIEVPRVNPAGISLPELAKMKVPDYNLQEIGNDEIQKMKLQKAIDSLKSDSKLNLMRNKKFNKKEV